MNVSKLCRVLMTVLACAMLLCSCSSVTKLHVNDNDTYTDRKTGVTYRPLSPCYEPSLLGEEYASFNLSGLTTMLHTVDALSPLEYLGSVHYGMYAAEDVAVPTFEQLDVTRVLIYSTHAPTIPTETLEAAEPDERAVIDGLRQAYLQGERVSYPSFSPQKASFTLRFEAKNLPGVYYCFSYIEYEEDIYEEIDGQEKNLGRYFIYDRYEKICVAVDASLHLSLYAN